MKMTPRTMPTPSPPASFAREPLRPLRSPHQTAALLSSRIAVSVPERPNFGRWAGTNPSLESAK